MNRVSRAAGWLLVGVGTLMSLAGVLALMGFPDLHLIFGPVEFDTPAEKVAWLGVWMLSIVAGVVLLRTSRTTAERERV